ncbi:MAG: sensor histidine kinase [Calditrichia bacterium]
MVKKNFFILLFVIFIFPVSSWGQLHRFYTYTRENGLSQNTIQDIIQDKSGYMWFATQDGLNRFDGYHFTRISSSGGENNALSDNFITALELDQRGNIWIGTNNQGINKFSPGSGTIIQHRPYPEHPDSLSFGNILSLSRFGTDSMIIGGPHGISIYSKPLHKFLNIRLNDDPQNPLNVSCLFPDSKANIWFATTGKGLGLLRLTKTDSFDVQFFPLPIAKTELIATSITSMVNSTDNYLLISTFEHGIFKFNTSTLQYERFEDTKRFAMLEQYQINTLMKDSRNMIWIGTNDAGALKYNPLTHEIWFLPVSIGDAISLNSNQILSIYEDRSGLIWFGTRDRGINKLDPGRSNFIWYANNPRDPNSLSHNIIRSFEEDRNGNLWVGTFGAGLDYLDRKTGKFHHISQTKLHNVIYNNHISDLHYTKNGYLWTGTWGDGLYVLKENKVIRHYEHDPNDPKSLSNNQIQCIYEDRTGDFWIGTENGLNVYDKKEQRFYRFFHDQTNPYSITDNRCQSNAIVQDSTGEMWVGTWNGLNRISYNHDSHQLISKRYFHSTDTNSLSDNRIISLLLESSSADSLVLWIGTYGGGLNRLSRIRLQDGTFQERFIHITTDDGLPSNIIYTILKDDHNRLWLSTNNGLCRLTYFPDGAPEIITFTVSNGLQSDQFFWGAAKKLSDGTMAFGGIQGFNLFHPDSIKPNTYIPPVVITEIKIFGDSIRHFTNVSSNSEISIGPEDKFMNIGFSALDYTNPFENQYRYFLRGYHASWVDLGNNHDVTLTNLSPGKYDLFITGSNNNKIWNPSGTVLHITVRPPWWNTLFFKIFMVLLFGMIIISIYKIRTATIRSRNRILNQLNQNLNKQIQEKEKLQQQLIQMQKMESIGILTGGISHDFNNILTVIQGHAELGLMKTEEERLRKDFNIILESTNKAKKLINQLLAFSRKQIIKPTKVQLNQVITDMRGMFERLLSEDIQIVTSLNPDLPPILADRNQIEQIIMNLVVNARDAFENADSNSLKKITITTDLEILNDSAEIEELAGKEGPHVVFSVSDTGPGIPIDIRDKIFDPFFTTKTPGKGTGLGLSTVFGIVQQNNAAIVLHSNPTTGTIFSIYWPVDEDLMSAYAEEPTSIDPMKLKISGNFILVEDDHQVRQYIEEALCGEAISIFSFERGKEALEFIKKNNLPIDLLITDVVMPEMSGKELVEKVKEIRPELQVLYVSGYAEKYIAEKGLLDRGVNFLHKPFTINELLLAISTLLGNKN